MKGVVNSTGGFYWGQYKKRKLKKALRTESSCIYCGNAWGTRVKAPDGITTLHKTIEHIAPTSAGGSPTDPRNLMAACQLCNSCRADRIFKDLESARKFIAAQWLKHKWQVEEQKHERTA